MVSNPVNQCELNKLSSVGSFIILFPFVLFCLEDSSLFCFVSTACLTTSFSFVNFCLSGASSNPQTPVAATQDLIKP